ncbi:MAG: pilus assembly protein TadG-related protein [Rhodobacteraceae bacterium]|nr:pilus assembly protein TadG-related protein [Paracoccaceae bacterium]
MSRRGNRLESCLTAALAARREGFGPALAQFRRDESGSLLIFGLFCFIIMMLVAGMALDLMRFEERRTLLQNTVDRASLAAADLNQTLAPKDVVKDYFTKAGLTPPKDSDITVTQGTYNEYRTVNVKVSEQMPTWFMNMVGVKELKTPAIGTAEERIGQVEVSLVLDVSGSMNSNNRLINLKPAAKSFIDQMFNQVEPGKLSMSIITYSTQVSIGPDLGPYFSLTNEHNKSNCIEFDAADFANSPNSLKISLAGTRTYQRNGHFDPFYTSAPQLWSCPLLTDTSRKIMAYSGDRNALKAFIDGLTASGNTSIDIGMKWGAALLDPSMHPVVDSYISLGRSPASFGDRPYPYKTATMTNANDQSMKVIVIMTDGENTTEYRLNPGYRSGISTVIRGNTSTSYTATNAKQYSVYDSTRAANSDWFSINTNSWRAEPWGDLSGDTGDSLQLTWPQIWERASINWIADNVISPAWGTTRRNQWRSSGTTVVNSVGPSTKDTYTLNICNAAKAKGVVIYTIGFEAPTVGLNLLSQCASTGNALSATGTGITTAFSAIAASINKLRLTQ